MNKKIFYPIAIIAFVVAIAFIFVRFKTVEKERSNYQLKERKGLLVEGEEYIRTRANAARLKMVLQENPADDKSALALASLFIQEARVTGDYVYYDKAAMHYVNDILKRDPANFVALTYKSLIYLSQHHFADGRDVAEQARKINPYNAFIYGVLVDANVEMGDYKQAIVFSDSMVSIRPDLSSYSRISYLREIHGDYPGAISAMNLAVDAGMPGEEGTEWARIQLAHLYENTGDLKRAEMHYDIALKERPNYPYALAGLGHLAAANKNYTTAINYYVKADSLITDYAVKEDLADMYRLAGQDDKANALAYEVINEMSKDSKAGLNNENIGHYADRELAYAYLKIKDYDNALIHALAEYNRRPKNNDANETVAWVYYNKKQADKALPFIKEALKTNSKNPTLLSRAGLIYAKAGDKVKAKTLLQSALKSNPVIADDLKLQDAEAMKSL